MNQQRRAWRPLVISGLLAVVAGICWSIGIFSTLSQRLNDRLFLPLPKDPRIVIVAIDEASLQSVGRWPWPRSVHAELIKKVREAGARTIAYDVNFSEPSTATDDQALVEQLQQTSHLVLPIEIINSQVTEPYTSFAQAVSSTGYTLVHLDRDGVVRRVPATLPIDGRTRVPFAFEAARLDQGTDVNSVPTDRYLDTLIHYPDAPGKAFSQVSADAVLHNDAAAMALLHDAVVFVGATARDLHDEQAVPTSFGRLMSGVEIHASLFYTITHQVWLMPAPLWFEWLYLLFIALLLGVSVPRFRPRISGVLAIFSIITWVMIAFVAFDHGWLVDLLWPALLTLFLYGALLLERWLETEQRRHELQQILSRYLSPSVVDSVLRDPTMLALGGRRRTMTMLFSDIRGFTSVSETMSPEELIRILNIYLGEMTDIVFQQEGVLDKYIGDAVMAFWNAPLDQPDHAVRAVKTALQMQKRLKELNESGVFPNGMKFAIGVGLNTGDVVVGNVGSERRFDYTVIGDQVNLASRVEGLTKEYGVAILITEQTRQAIGEAFLVRALDRVAVKGKKASVPIYEVLSTIEEATDAQRKKVTAYEQVLEAYYQQRFTTARQLAELFQTYEPDDGAMKVLLAHIDHYEKSPPGEGWDGAWVMTKK